MRVKKTILYLLPFWIFLSCNLRNKEVEFTHSVPYQNLAASDTISPFLSIAGLGPDGDSIKFANIKARYVLVEFWASWCPPCRQFNPGLVDLFKKFNTKGFEILSISLDHNADKWRNAILKDNLYWKNHISDLGGWDSHWAVNFGIESIPANFLIDSSGRVLAKDFNHDQLEETLKTLLK